MCIAGVRRCVYQVIGIETIARAPGAQLVYSGMPHRGAIKVSQINSQRPHTEGIFVKGD